MLAFGCVADTYPAGEALLRRGASVSPAIRPGWPTPGLLRRPAGRVGRTWPPQRPANCIRREVFRTLQPIWQPTRTAC